MKPVIAVLLVLVALPLAGQTITVDPPQPVAGAPFTLRLQGLAQCLPAGPIHVLVAGDTVVVTTGAETCGGSFPNSYDRTFTLPPLPAGTYRVLARRFLPFYPLANLRNLLSPLGETMVTVTGAAAPFTVSPSWGETKVTLRGNFGPVTPDTTVTFGGVAAGPLTLGEDVLIVEGVPELPASAGAVDVVVRRGGQTLTCHSCYSYVAVEKRLLPSYVEGVIPGAHGSRWRTIFEMFHSGNVQPIAGVDTRFSPRGDHAYYTIRSEMLPGIAWSLRVRDESRAATTYGTEVPIVRVADFPDGVQLYPVPIGGDFRQTLRLFHERNEATIAFWDGKELIHSMTTALRSVDLGSMPELAGHDRIRITVNGGVFNPLWAYVSVTHNETQHVTLVTPQR
ncbi:MAG TPA: IPT/TIG domain-containing protein [Thermoanaerobaculia bacterium]